MLRGEKRVFFGLSEPSGGSDPARAIQTRAVRDGNDHWVLNGTKLWISGADRADYGLVFARTGGPGRAGVTAFIVETNWPGFKVARVVHTLRSAKYATEIQMEDLRVPHENILGEEGGGFAIANDRLARQIRQAADFGRNTPGRLAGVAGPEFAAVDAASFAQAKKRVEDSVAFVKTLTRVQIEGTEDKDIVWTAGGKNRKMKGAAYLQQFGLPNFFFFVTTAYDILRHRGVPLSKPDFMGPVSMG